MGNEVLWLEASDILNSAGMQYEKGIVHHAGVSEYDHSRRVAVVCLAFSKFFSPQVNRRRLVRGALLHDYFL